MKRFTMPMAAWSDARFAVYQQQTGWRQAKALGVLVLLWAQTRQMCTRAQISDAELSMALQPAHPKQAVAREALLTAGYLQENDGCFVVVDNINHFAAAEKFRESGKRGGYQKHKKKRSKAVRVAKDKQPSATAEAWRAYKAAYEQRYNVTPVYNSAVFGQLAKIVANVGQQDAPRLAAFYLQHDGAYYVRCQHHVGAMLKDYAGLYTQMQRNVQVTEHDVRAHSDGGRLEAQLSRLRA